MRFICIAFLVFLQFANAQKKERPDTQKLDAIPLSRVLAKLEARHHIKFSYNPEHINNYKIALDMDVLSLDESISLIESTFRIVFDKIDDRYYTLIKQTKHISICGYLKNPNGLTPVEGVNIQNQTTKEGAVSDRNGFFTLNNNNENDIITISFLGYKTLTLSVGETAANKCETYVLSLDSFALEEVVVQEYLGVGISQARDGSIKIDPNNQNILSGLSEPDILQNIQLLPGIESPGETASGLYIRGGSPDQNLILWDGIKMYNSNHFFGMISAFNPYVTKNVSIHRSGTNPRYGDRISGVIDITTDNIVPKKVEGQIGLNTTHADAHIKMPVTKDFGLFLSTRRSLAEVFRSPAFISFANKVFQNTIIAEDPDLTNSDFVEDEGVFNFFDITLKAILNVSKKDKITASTLLTRNRLNYILRAEGFDDPSSVRLRIRNYGAIASWSHFSSDYFKFKNEVYYSQYDFDYSGQNPFVDGGVVSNKTNDIKEIGYSLSTDWKINETFKLSSGYQFFSNQVAYSLTRNDITTDDNTNGPTHTIYSHLKYEKFSDWRIDLGFRATQYASLNSFHVEPRIYVERMFNENFRLKASAEIKNQAVSQIIEFATQDFGLENQVWVLAEEDIVPLLRSDQLSAGFFLSKNGWNMDVEAYYKNIDGFTTFTRGFESSSQSFSEGNSQIRGVDILLKKKINRYTTWLGYTFSETNFLFDDINQGNRFSGNNNIKHSLTWSQFYKWKDFQFSLGWKYRTGIPYTLATGFINDPDNLSITYDAVNSEVLPDYHRLDFSVLYDFKLGKKNDGPSAKVGFSLLNLYARRNILSRNYGLFEETDENGGASNITLRKIDKYSLGITPFFFFRVKF